MKTIIISETSEFGAPEKTSSCAIIELEDELKPALKEMSDSVIAFSDTVSSLGLSEVRFWYSLPLYYAYLDTEMLLEALPKLGATKEQVKSCEDQLKYHEYFEWPAGVEFDLKKISEDGTDFEPLSVDIEEVVFDKTDCFFTAAYGDDQTVQTRRFSRAMFDPVLASV